MYVCFQSYILKSQSLSVGTDKLIFVSILYGKSLITLFRECEHDQGFTDDALGWL